SAFAKIADVSSARAFDHVDSELEQANFPSVVDALNNGAEGFVCVFDATLRPIDDGVQRIAQRFFGHIGFSELKAITQDRDVAQIFAQFVDITLRFLAEASDQKARA